MNNQNKKIIMSYHQYKQTEKLNVSKNLFSIMIVNYKYFFY